MERTLTIILFIGLLAILSCSNVSGRIQTRRSNIKKETDLCRLAPERGRCRMSQSKWYYDSSNAECRNFTYGGCGGNLNKFATKAACERVCKTGCRDESCSRSCPDGFIIDAKGCNTCRCQPSPDQAFCPAIECPERCPQGYLTDSHGCMNCECRTEEVSSRVSSQHDCPPVCYMYCPFGNKKDENDCDICSCKSKEEACGSQQCMMLCPTGFVTDSRGCELCQCNSAAEINQNCSVNQCLKECHYGFQKDSFGCEICACATWRNRQRQASDCSNSPICSMYCPNGFLKGRDGCDICRCAQGSSDRRLTRIERRQGKGVSSEDDCGIVMCRMHCAEGFQKDSKGCDTCACRQAGNHSNAASQLPANVSSSDTPAQLPAEVSTQIPVLTDCIAKRCHKRMTCSFGFAKDEFGCDTCVCNHARSRNAKRRES